MIRSAQEASAAGAVQPGVAPMSLQSGSRLPIARYRLSVRMQRDLELPGYAGSLLRGQFGAALRRLSCTVDGTPCDRCERNPTCGYPAIFDSPGPRAGSISGFEKSPNPYVIEPPACTQGIPAGELLIFHLVLVGHSSSRLALIVKAWQLAFQNGIGASRSSGRLEEVERLGPYGSNLTVWNCERDQIYGHDIDLEIPAFGNVTRTCLTLGTPLRLSRQGQILGAVQVRPVDLLASVIRRTTLLLRLHAGIECFADGPTLLAEARALQDERSLTWRHWRRFSARQRREMSLGGLVGQWTLDGALDRLMPWLWLAQYLHVGKNATFGLGKIDIATAAVDV